MEPLAPAASFGLVEHTMSSFALIFRPLLVLAVLTVTGPWCCCMATAMLPQSGNLPMGEEHGCCPAGERTPAHAPHDGGNCDKGCSVIASMPDAAGCAIAPIPDSGSSLFDMAGASSPTIIIDITGATVGRAEPPGPVQLILRSLYAQNCLLTI